MTRVLIGSLFLLAAGAWAWIALQRGEREPALEVRVRVLDAAGGPVPGGEVRTRYGGTWTRTDARGEVRLAGPRVKAGLADPTAALSDALEARGPYHALRRGRRGQVARGKDGLYEAEVRLEHCGIFRLGVAMTGFAEARALLDPDPVRERWRLIEGNDVVRAGQAATWAVFPGAERLWVTLEGHQGVAQQRLYFTAPGPGFLIEKTLFPQRAQPIAGHVSTRTSSRFSAATLAGVLEVTELSADAEPVPRAPVRIEADGTFRVDYTGEGKFQLQARCPFLDKPMPVVAAGGDTDVWIHADPLPWIEVTLPGFSRDAALVVVSLFAEGGGTDVLAPGGALATEKGLQVAVDGQGPHALSLVFRGGDDAPPRAGEAVVDVPLSGAVEAALTLRDLPHGTVAVRLPNVPERGGEVRVLPDRTRTVLPRPGETATFRHVGVGTAFVNVRWQHPDFAREFLITEVRAAETTEITVPAERGGRLRLDVSGTPVEDDPRPWALHLLAGSTPYGKAEGTLPLLRVRENEAPYLLGDGALRPGVYRAELHVTVPDGPLPLPVAFEIRAGEETRVSVKAP